MNAKAKEIAEQVIAGSDPGKHVIQHVTQLQSIPRNGTAEDQAGEVSFVAADDAAFITGQTILADGGQGRT
jgi:NAD(P)-dependent dehydrogenase (short-subunit alcohol dehydrogenase family)